MAALPAKCQKIRDQINAANNQIKQIQKAPGYLTEGGKPNPEDLYTVKQLQQQVKSLNTQLNACLVKNVQPFPIRITASSIYCLEEQETGILQDDEPYLLIAGVNLKGGLVPNLTVTRYGPVANVNEGESKSFSFPAPFWALNNKDAQTIANPSDVIFLVACMENDDGSAAVQRTLVQAQLIASLAGSVGFTRDQLVKRLIKDMNDAVKTPTGFPDADDRIGSVKELTLSALDLVRPILGPQVKKLDFSGSGAKYSVSIKLTAG